MSSKTDVANRALSKLGHPRVSNLDTTDTEAARTIREMWDIVRDVMLQSYSWNFAVKRVSLAADSSTPSWEYDYQYRLPTDFLTLLEIENDPDYRVEEGYIRTNKSAPLYIKYVARIESVGSWTPLFIEAFASKLAYEACERITQSNTKKQLLLQDFQMIINTAFTSDAIEDPALGLPEDSWITERL